MIDLALGYRGSLMAISLWAILAFAVFLISTVALSGERSLAALAIQKGAVIAALIQHMPLMMRHPLRQGGRVR